MNIESRIKKLIGHSDKLLTFYLGTVRKYSILDPMIFSQDVCGRFGSGKADSGYRLLRSTLFYSVVQDIANLFYDHGKTNPSVMNIYKMIDDGKIIDELRKRYITEYIPDEALKVFYKHRSHERTIEFNKYKKELCDQIKTIEKDQKLRAIKSIRDKFTAHIDLQFTNDNYEYHDIAKYSLKWNSLKRVLNDLKPIIESIGFVVRGADFAWDSFEQQNQKIADGLWNK